MLNVLGGIYIKWYILLNYCDLSIGKYLWSSVTGYSYAIMFGINASLLLSAILYALWRLKWRTTDSQQPIPCNFFSDFFDCDHVVQSVKAVVRKRPGNRRTYLVILFIAMALYTFQRGQCILYYSMHIQYSTALGYLRLKPRYMKKLTTYVKNLCNVCQNNPS